MRNYTSNLREIGLHLALVVAACFLFGPMHELLGGDSIVTVSFPDKLIKSFAHEASVCLSLVFASCCVKTIFALYSSLPWSFSIFPWSNPFFPLTNPAQASSIVLIGSVLGTARGGRLVASELPTLLFESTIGVSRTAYYSGMCLGYAWETLLFTIPTWMAVSALAGPTSTGHLLLCFALAESAFRCVCVLCVGMFVYVCTYVVCVCLFVCLFVCLRVLCFSNVWFRRKTEKVKRTSVYGRQKLIFFFVPPERWVRQ